MNHNFSLSTNVEFHGRANRRANLIHLSDEHPILNDMLLKYNQLNEETRNMHDLTKFKKMIKLNLMTFDEDFSPISPYIILN